MLELLKEFYRSEIPECIRKSVASISSWISKRAFFALGFVFITFTWLVWALFGREFINWRLGSKNDTYENVGQFGDSFGSLNTLFAGIAALGAVMAYLSQKEQLQDAKKASEKQQFESTFFQLLNTFHEIVRSIVYRQKNADGSLTAEYHGREALQLLTQELEGFEIAHVGTMLVVMDDVVYGDSSSDDAYIKALGKAYERFFNSNSPILSHYFRMLYRLLAFVSDSKRPDANVYGQIIRAQLSDHELLLLFYNGLVEHGEKMNKFVKEFALLKHLPRQTDIFSKFPDDNVRKFYGSEKAPNGDEISPAYCDEDDRKRILSHGKTSD